MDLSNLICKWVKCMMTFDLLLSFPEFNVTLYISPSVVEEGMTVNVNCTHNIPNGSISWLQSNELQEEKKEILQIKYILKTSVVNCSVNSVCGNYNSGFTIEVKGDCTNCYL